MESGYRRTSEPSGRHVIRWHRETRYYTAILARDIFGQWCLTRVWGRRGSPMGGLRVDPFESFSCASAALERLAKRRQRRGYRVAWESADPAAQIE
jgi:predicted DNA-binding WGR domain protein